MKAQSTISPVQVSTAIKEKSKTANLVMHRLKGECIFELNTIDLLDVSYRCKTCGRVKERTLESEVEKGLLLDEILSEQ